MPGYRAQSDPVVEARVRAVETSLPALRLEGRAETNLSLQGWMEVLDIPGLSLAVIEGGDVVWARGYGVLASDGEEPVTAETLFQSASLSKPLTALALLHHAERGAFDLDAPINEYLETWKVRTKAGAVDQDVTLRQLLAHTAGITPGGFSGYPEGELLPTLPQILDGVPPAANPPARVVGQPGVQVQYSGLGFEIIQLALTERLGRPFPEILRASLFQQLGLAATTTELVPAPPRGGIALGHDVDGTVLAGGWHRYPETAAAGIWSTPAELGRVLIEVHRALRGESDRVISQATAAQMLSEVMDGEGLSWVLDLSGGALAGFSHSGGNAGFRAHMRMVPETGQGLVLMANSDNGQLLFSPLLHSVASVYGWPDQPARDVPRHVAVRILAARGLIDVSVPLDLLERYAGRYELEPGLVFDVEVAGGTLAVRLGDQPRLSVYPESRKRFYYREVNAQLTFLLGESPGTDQLILHQYGRELTAPRIDPWLPE